MQKNFTLLKLNERLKFGFVMLVFTTMLTFIYFVINLIRCQISVDPDILSWSYFLPSALGHAALFALLLFIAAYLPFALLFKNYRIATIVYVLCGILLQLFTVIDGFVFALYRFHINGFVWELIVNGGTDVFVFDLGLIFKFSLLAIVACILPYIIAWFIGLKLLNRFDSHKIKIISIILFLCVAFSHITHAYAAAKKQTSVQRIANVLPFFFPLSANGLLTRMGIVDPNDRDNLTYNSPTTGLSYPLKPMQYTNLEKKRNIVYILIDSWNPLTFDSIVCPNITRFASKAHYFSNHQSSSNGTRGSIFGLFFGLSYTYEKDFIINKMSPLFIDRLIDLNYNIQTFPSATLTAPPFHEIIFRRIPDIRLDSEGSSVMERDNYITNTFTDFISNEHKEPFFSFLFYDLPHAISIPAEHRTRFVPSWDKADYMKLNNDIDPAPFFNLYKNCVYYTDSLVGNVLDSIEKQGLLDNTIIIIVGDHGQEFNENKMNYWIHGSNYSKWQINVPLVVYYPGIEAQEYSHTTTHYDITPTIMNKFMGVKNPAEDYTMGNFLYDTTNRLPHIVGDHVNYGFVLENQIITTNHMGSISVTDKQMNKLPNSATNAREIKKAIDKKNKFYIRPE